MSDLLFKVVDFKRREESKRSQVESHDGWDALLEQTGGVEKGSVPTKAHNEVNLIRQVILAL